MALTRATRAKLLWALELALGLELYACAVLALHSRGLRAAPIVASPGMVIPALVIPPVFYLLMGLVSVRPLSVMRVGIAAGAMCAVHAVLVMATGALFVIPDLVDYGAAVAFSLWGSPVVTILQLTATPLVLARLRPLIVVRPVPGGTPARRADVHTMAPAPTAVREPVPRGSSRGNAAAPQRTTAVMSHTVGAAPTRTVTPTAAKPSRPASVVREPTAPVAPAPAPRAPIASSSAAISPATSTPVGRSNAITSPLESPDRRASVEPVDPRVRVAVSRIADQLPVEMFARGAKGLSDMLRPGVSLFIPRSLLLPHLAQGVAPVKWEVVADQFPRDELLLTNAEIAKRLPNGSLRLPLDEVMPQIPAELFRLSTQPPAASRTVELPPPVQLHVPLPVTAAVGVHEMPDFHRKELRAPVDDAPNPVVAASGEEELAVAEPWRAREANGIVMSHGRTAEARRIAALLAPVMNGLEVAERDGAGTPLVTAIAPTLSDDAVVAAALQVVPWLSDPRLPEPVSQAALAARETTIVLTPFESTRGDALLVAAAASRGSLARLERLSRSVAGGPPSVARNGLRAPEDSDAARELRPTVVPPSMREVASSFTSIGAVAPAVLSDGAGLFRVCLFGPDAFEPVPLARLARDLFGAVEETKIGPVISITLRLQTHRLVVRAVGSSGGQTTILVVVGSMARPGLARLELERAAKVLGG